MTTDFFEDNLKELMFGLNDIQKQAFQAGFEAGKKAKEKDLLKEAKIEEAQVEQAEEKEFNDTQEDKI